MAYQFSNEILAKIKVTDDSGADITLNGINGRENSADVIMGGISIMFDLAGWGVNKATRVIDQKIEETT